MLSDRQKKLLSQCKIHTFKSSGKGGQHSDKTDSAVRITHLKTGITTFSQKSRSQFQNKKECLLKLEDILMKKNQESKERISTKTPWRSKQKRLQNKKYNSLKKKLRKNPDLNS